jgi:uncharacterized protein (TIGR02271 family)
MSASNFLANSASNAEQSANTALNTAMNTGMAWFDMMVNFQREMQRASLQSFSSYSPTTETRISGRMPQQASGIQVIPVGEERLNVATRTVQGETTRIRRRVVAQPVEQQVTLRDEKVIVERRPATGTNPKPDVLTETVIEMSDSTQVPTVWKSLHVAEEVVLRKQVTERTEKVRETVRRDVVDVEHDRAEVLVTQTHEVEGHVDHLPALRHDAEDNHRAQARTEMSTDKRQHDELSDSKKPVQGAHSPAPPAPRKN